MRRIRKQSGGLFPDERERLAKVDMGVARRMLERHEHLARSKPGAAHIVLHRHVAAVETVFVAQPLENPLRRMTVLHRHVQIVRQDPIDDRRERIELWSLLRPLGRLLFALIARRLRIGADLTDRLPRQTELPDGIPATATLNENEPANRAIDLHRIHLPAGPSRLRKGQAIPPDTKHHVDFRVGHRRMGNATRSRTARFFTFLGFVSKGLVYATINGLQQSFRIGF